ncbi:cobalamin biosynthesis protein CobW [Aliiruegeria haliotis]|uniref:Cobalamin biosynthesis protein CobW n=2 Tax=Aliiruegeria haliotis TaxID=1280846 RepID=A0A2T0RYE0_9RHOB|nr:cobalamin biosynthesis protein CobW [Aliiruegeria haliotis]
MPPALPVRDVIRAGCSGRSSRQASRDPTHPHEAEEPQDMAQKIPATVVTGFLGAGKTTLIRHLIENANGKRIALIINEFGDLGVDGEILKGCGIEGCAEDDVVELSNGCICCTVAEDFLPAMQKLIDRDEAPDHIVIETSGLALPQPLVRAFNWPDIRTRVTVDGVVAVVDGPALSEGRFAANEAAVDAQREADDTIDHETPLSELFEDQLACADMVVVNKADLLGAAAATSLTDKLRGEVRKGVSVLHSEMGAVDAAVLLGLGIGAEDDMESRHEVHHHHHHHDDDDDDHDDHDHEHAHGHDEFESFVVTRPEIADPTAFAAQVADVIRAHDILRLKGFAAVSGKPMRLTVQAVGPRIDSYFDRPFGATEPRETRLVVIGQAGLDRSAIEKALAA